MSAQTSQRKTAAKKVGPAEDVAPAALAELDGPAQDGPIGEDGEIRPIQIGKRGRRAPEMVTIFTIDDVEYQIPKEPSPGLLLKFMREARSRSVGQDVATMNLLTAMIGDEAVEALSESPDVTIEDIADVMAVVSHVAFGSIKNLRQAADPS